MSLSNSQTCILPSVANGGFADVMKVKILRWRRYPEVASTVLRKVLRRGTLKREELDDHSRRWSHVLWRLKKGPRVKEGRWLPEAGRGKGIHCFLDPPEGTRLCENLDFILRKYILNHLAQICKKISYAGFKPLSLWKQQELPCLAASLYLPPGMILVRILRFGFLCSMMYAPEAGKSWVPVQNVPDSNLLYIFFLTIKKGF